MKIQYHLSVVLSAVALAKEEALAKSDPWSKFQLTPCNFGVRVELQTPSKKSEESKKQLLLGELLFLGGSKTFIPDFATTSP